MSRTTKHRCNGAGLVRAVLPLLSRLARLCGTTRSSQIGGSRESFAVFGRRETVPGPFSSARRGESQPDARIVQRSERRVWRYVATSDSPVRSLVG